MRALLGILVFSMILLPLVGNSYAYSVKSELEKNNFYIYAQIEVKNSEDQIVAYLESKKIVVYNLEKLNKMLDENSGGIEKSTITIGGKQYEMIKGVGTTMHPFPTVVSKNIIAIKINDLSETLVYADHNGYPVVAGDKVVTTWTIIRPLH